LTKDQIQYLLYNNDIQVVAAPKPEGIEEEEEEDESKEPTPVGRFLNDTGNPDLLPPSRRFSWYRHYCPVSLVKESKLVYGLPEYSIMVSGKVYVMSSKETYDEFQSRSYFYIAARPTLPTTRTACVISFNYSNNAARHASAVICKKYGLRLLSAEDSVTDLARGPNGVEAEKLAQHMMSRVNENKEKGWIMEGCPLNTTHVAPLMKEGFQPDVVVVFPPKEEGDDDNEVPTTNTATSESESESVISESKLVDPTASLAAYAEDYPNLIALMKENGLNVVEVPHSCIIKNNSTPSVYGNIDDMIGWIDQSVNPMKQRADPVPPMDENPLNLSSCTGIYCPVSLKNGTVAQGKEDLFTFLDGAKYNFVDTRAKEQFDASPWLYVKSVQSSNGSIDPASTSPPLRVMIVGAKGASRKEIVNSVSSTCNLNIICLDDDEEYVNTMKKLMTPPPPIINEDGEEEEQELLEIPPPENYVLPILERLLVKNSNNGTVIDGNPAIFTPEVVNWMIKNRYHPSAVINCSLDAQLVVDRRMKNEFKWSPPPLPEPKVSTGEEDEDEEEEEDLPPPPTKEELEEMEEEARNELAAKIMEETENSIAACETTVESLASFDVAALNTSIAVGLRLACSRVTSTIKKHTTNVQENLSKNAVVPLSPLVSEEGEEDEIDRDEVNTAKETSRIVSLKLIQSGCKSLSRFGTRDPVHFCETKGESGSENEMGYAVAHRHQIYFLDSASNRSKFINNPMLYLNNPITKGTYASPFPLSRSTISVCIVGSPFCGKTTVAKKLCNDTGAIYLNPENVLQWALLPSNLASLPCCQRVRDQMTAGKSIQSPRGEGGMSDLLLQCLSARMNRFDVKANGYVLDDFPSNVNEATAMSLNNDLRPSVIFSMEGISPKETLIRAKKVFLEKKNVEPTKETKWRHKTLKRLQTWYNDKEIIKATISQSYLNIKTIVVKDQSSKWSLSNCAHSVVRKLRRKTSAHMTALAHHTPAPLDGITMHCNHLMSRRGHLGGYCPVQLKDANRLVATMNGSINQRQFGTIYQGRVYSCSNLESLDTFNSNPIKYINNQELPKNLPLVVPLGAHLREKIATLAFGGYCPVTFYEGKGSRDWSSIVEADPICVVKYKSVFYGFQSVSKRTKFMETPEKYCNQTLPLKLPPKMKTKSMDELKRGGLHGVLAVVEQSLSVATQEALIKLGNNRLKFPSLSVTETASKFFGLFLKSINPSCKSNSLKQRYELKLQEFIKECQLVDFLNDNQEVMNSSTPRRGVAGIKGLRSMSDDQKKSMEEYLINARKFEMLCGEKSEQLYERYMRDV
jgi:adenylate kinase family enzyme/YHS domain-containing protein